MGLVIVRVVGRIRAVFSDKRDSCLAALRLVFLLALVSAISACGDLDQVFCSPAGCDISAEEWRQISALADLGGGVGAKILL